MAQDPDEYRREHGRCPAGYRFDGDKCIPKTILNRTRTRIKRRLRRMEKRTQAMTNEERAKVAKALLDAAAKLEGGPFADPSGPVREQLQKIHHKYDRMADQLDEELSDLARELERRLSKETDEETLRSGKAVLRTLAEDRAQGGLRAVQELRQIAYEARKIYDIRY